MLWDDLPTPFTALAPMEDVTDTAFRQLVRECHPPDIFFTEFTSCDGLCSRGRERVIHRLKYGSDERPIVAQVWGNNPENYFQTGRILTELQFDGVDINLGCPVPKIVKSGHCSALIEQPNLVAELVSALREGAPELPLSLKTRIGFRKIATEQWCGFLLDLKPDALIVHGRTAKQDSTVPADWNEIAKVVRLRDELEVATKIVGNGDVRSYRQCLDYHARFGVDGVMIGRGIFGNLFVFDPRGKRLEALPVEDRLALLRRHIELFREAWGTTRDFAILRRFFKVYVAGFSGAVRLRTMLMETSSDDEAFDLIRQFSDKTANPDQDPKLAALEGFNVTEVAGQ